MEKFKDKYPLVLDKSNYNALKREYARECVGVDYDRACEYTKISFWAILICCICVFQVIWHLSIFYIPLYYVAAYLVEGLIDIYFIRILPQRQINKIYEKREEDKKQKELAETEKKLLAELQEQVFTKEKAKDIVDKYKSINYPKYLEKEIELLFKRIDVLIEVADRVENYKSFFTAHMAEVLEIVAKEKEDCEEIELAKNAVKALSDFVAKEIKQHRLGVSLDENSTLQAYINLYNNGKGMGEN